MAETQLAQIQMRRDTAANWTSEDPTLASGEWGLETDTDKIKIGDGSTSWSSLDYRYEKLEAVMQTASAWVNFNGTGTVSINDSYNVSSITDIGTGAYDINFATDLDNTNYGVCGVGTGGSTTGTSVHISAVNAGSALTVKTTSSVRVIYNSASGYADPYDLTIIGS